MMYEDQFSEFIGILFEDGKIDLCKRHGFKVRIWCNSHEKEYIQHVSNLISNLFGKTPSITISQKNCTTVRFYSRAIVQQLFDLGVPVSHKGQMRIPAWTATNKSQLCSFLRGLFDTDGGIVLQKYNKYTYTLLKITMKSKDFAEDVRLGLRTIGCRPYICKKARNTFVYDVVLRRNSDIQMWREYIGSNHPHKSRKLERQVASQNGGISTIPLNYLLSERER